MFNLRPTYVDGLVDEDVRNPNILCKPVVHHNVVLALVITIELCYILFYFDILVSPIELEGGLQGNLLTGFGDVHYVTKVECSHNLQGHFFVLIQGPHVRLVVLRNIQSVVSKDKAKQN